MQRLSLGTTAIVLLGIHAIATGAEINTVVVGTMANSVNGCINIIPVLTGSDCSYAGTRYPAMATWRGPYFSGGFYAQGSSADGDVNYVPTPGDGKLAVPLTGTVTIDDKGTATDPTDDTIAATWTFGAAVFSGETGNGDHAVERWDSWTHLMSATAANFVTPNGAGGFDYVIGSRGAPAMLASASNPADRFGSENAGGALDSPGFWSTTGSTGLSVGERIGIERSPGYGNTDGSGGVALQPNVGAQTTANFVNYECFDSSGDNDCATSELLFGSGLPSGSTASPPGFENLILLLSTGPDGLVTFAQAWWTREFLLRNGPAIGDDPSNINAWTTNNSWMGGSFSFTAVPLPGTAWLLPTAFGAATAWRRRRKQTPTA